MNLPLDLNQKIELELNQYSLKNIKIAYEEMSHYYRKNRDNISLSLNTPEKRCAYIAARMPATFSTVKSVLNEIENSHECNSLLDVGAGCGTASFASCEIFKNLTKVTAIEQNSEMVKIGKRLANDHAILKQIDWRIENILAPSTSWPKSDAVVLSYSLNEISHDKHAQLIANLWALTNKYLIIIEPGTQESFHIIHSVRNLFTSSSQTILAPCSHAQTCPAFAVNDLCHFSTRVQRTSLHRYLKEGERGFEDEKYSYLILTKIPKQNYDARVVRTPIIRPGLISLKLCTNTGFSSKIYSKKDKELYKKMKNITLGDKLTENGETNS